MFNIRLEQGVVFITVQKEDLIAADAPHVHVALRQALMRYRKDAVVNMSGVAMLDSPVIGALVRARDEYGAANLALGLCCLSRAVAHIFRCLHLDLRFPIFDTREDAALHVRPRTIQGQGSQAIVTLCRQTRCLSFQPSRGDADLCQHPHRDKIEDTRRCALYHTDRSSPAAGGVPNVVYTQDKRPPIHASPSPPQDAPQAPPAPVPLPKPVKASAPEQVVREFIESINTRDWRAAYETMASEFSTMSLDEYRLTREAYYKKMSASGHPPQQFLVRVASAEVFQERALLRCVRKDVSGWNEREYNQDFALELRAGEWKIARIFTGGRRGMERRAPERQQDVQDRRG